MTESRFPAVYKKTAGDIIIADGQQKLQWKPSEAGKQQDLELEFKQVTNLQASSANSDKLRLKVIYNPDTVYLFAFNDRQVMDQALSSLRSLVQKQRTKAENAKAKAANNISLDAKKILQNLQLQQSLLMENKELMKTFQQVVIQGGLPNDEFWSTRIHMLRAHALTSSQRRGPYNVLSTIRPATTSDNQINVSLTRDKIHDIFEQYPIVRQAYDENVPKISESDFWGRFFMSRLFRKLRGERTKTTDAIDPVLDKYMDMETQTGDKRTAGAMTGASADIQVPLFIDVEGNEQQDSQRLGNRPDMTMRPGQAGRDSLSLIRSMNNLSQKITYGGEGVPTAKAIEFDEQEFARELFIDGLSESQHNSFVALNVNDQDDNEQVGSDSQTKSSNGLQASALTAVIDSFNQPIDLQSVLEQDEEAIKQAQHQIQHTITLRSKEQSGNKDEEEVELEKRIIDIAQLSHTTSVEFLRHFWIAFQSGDPSQAQSVVKLSESLQKSLQRLDSVILDSGVYSGKVRAALSPIIVSINHALTQYNKALAESAGTPATAM